MEKILELIKKYNRILIFGHVRPDGDCIGSQYGLYHIIKDSFPNKEVYVSGEVSNYCKFVGEPTMVDDSLFKGSLAICVDIANSERVSDQRYKNCDYVLKIDHHPSVEEYGDYNYVDSTAPACAQILTEFYDIFKNELVMSKEAATALYVGLNTDTGRFKFDSVKSKTFNIAALLLEKGVDLSYVDNNLSVESLNSLKFKGYVLSNFKMTPNGFAYIIVKKETIKEFDVTKEEAANQVTAISTINTCPSWAMFIEYDNEIRIRLRSRGPIINTLAEKYKGGGHPKAAGASLDSWDDLDKFLSDIDNLVKEYKKNNA